jgi:hypothetical protein
VSKCMLLKNFFSHVQGLNCEKNVYELKDHVRQEALNSNLLLKLELVKKFLLHVFPIICQKMFELDLCFPMPISSSQGVKQDTTWVTRRTNVKLPYQKGHVPTYPMKNEMSLIHHVIKR